LHSFTQESRIFGFLQAEKREPPTDGGSSTGSFANTPTKGRPGDQRRTNRAKGRTPARDRGAERATAEAGHPAGNPPRLKRATDRGEPRRSRGRPPSPNHSTLNRALTTTATNPNQPDRTPQPGPKHQPARI